MKKSFRLAIALIATLLSCKKGENQLKPEFRPIVEAVYASGKLLPEDGHKLFAMNDGIITSQNIEEGSRVSAGDIIFSIDNTNQNSRLKSISEGYQMANSNYDENGPILSELKTQLESARIKFTNDSTNFERFKNLWTENATTKNDFDKATLTYKMSRNDFEMVRKRYKRTKNQLFMDKENAKTQLDLAAKDLSFTSVKSDIDGELFETYKKQGEAVRRNDPVAYVGKGNSFYIQLWIDEEDIIKVKPDQKALITIDMIKGKVFEAVITKIYPILTADNQSVKVEAKLTSTLSGWVVNASAEANIIISQKEKALTIPKSLLAGSDSVWISSDGSEKKIRITKGIETIDYVEVLGGLDANSVLIQK